LGFFLQSAHFLDHRFVVLAQILDSTGVRQCPRVCHLRYQVLSGCELLVGQVESVLLLFNKFLDCLLLQPSFDGLLRCQICVASLGIVLAVRPLFRRRLESWVDERAVRDGPLVSVGPRIIQDAVSFLFYALVRLQPWLVNCLRPIRKQVRYCVEAHLLILPGTVVFKSVEVSLVHQILDFVPSLLLEILSRLHSLLLQSQEGTLHFVRMSIFHHFQPGLVDHRRVLNTMSWW
jgi:hypothetical protein